jgi:hypothetical protein
METSRQSAGKSQMHSLDTHAPGTLNFRIGGIAFAVTTGDPRLKLGTEGALRPFLVDGGEPEVRLRAARADRCVPPPGEKLFDAGTLWQLHRQGEGYLFRFTAPCFGPEPYKTASFNVDFTYGEICLRDGIHQKTEAVYPLEYPLDELLMMNLLARGRGIEVHGCGVEDADGKGYLFLGQSGAGKSTMARLWTAGETTAQAPYILSDDRIILRMRGGRLWMYGTPWHGEAELASPRRSPVHRIFFLGRGAGNEMRPLAQPGAIARILARSFIPFHSHAGLAFTLEFLQQVTASVPCVDFRFVPDRRAVDAVRNAALSHA